jgi:hypothetical protein
MCSVCYVLYSVDCMEHTYVFCVLCSIQCGLYGAHRCVLYYVLYSVDCMEHTDVFRIMFYIVWIVWSTQMCSVLCSI